MKTCLGAHAASCLNFVWNWISFSILFEIHLNFIFNFIWILFSNSCDIHLNFILNFILNYPFTHDMQQGGVDNVIADICTLLRREIFHVDDTFFDKTGTLVEFSQLCHYERFAL
jgi:hypothetical protein